MTTDTSHDDLRQSPKTYSEAYVDHLKSELKSASLGLGTLSYENAMCLATARSRIAEERHARREAERCAAGLRKELADMTAVAQELDASSKRMQERAETAERRLQQQNSGEDDEVIAGLRELLTQERNTVCQLEYQVKSAGEVADGLRTRAQKAEAELSTVKMQHEKDRTALAGYREANGEMDRIMRQQEDRIRHLERVIDGLRAEVSHSTVEAPDAVA